MSMEEAITPRRAGIVPVVQARVGQDRCCRPVTSRPVSGGKRYENPNHTRDTRMPRVVIKSRYRLKAALTVSGVRP